MNDSKEYPHSGYAILPFIDRPLSFSGSFLSAISNAYRNNQRLDMWSHEKHIQSLSERNLTSFGRVFRAAVQGGVVIDLGCGIDDRTAWAIPLISGCFGAKKYIGVDRHRQEKSEKREGLEIEYKDMEILHYLEQMSVNGKIVVVMSGLEFSDGVSADDRVQITQQFYNTLKERLPRGSYIAVGPSGTSPELLDAPKRVFNHVASAKEGHTLFSTN